MEIEGDGWWAVQVVGGRKDGRDKYFRLCTYLDVFRCFVCSLYEKIVPLVTNEMVVAMVMVPEEPWCTAAHGDPQLMNTHNPSCTVRFP